MDDATAAALNILLTSVSSTEPAMHLPILDGSQMPNAASFIQDLDRQDEDLDAALEKTDPRLLQPSAVPEDIRALLTPIDYKILDLWSRGVATRKISKALKEAGEDGMTQKAVENKIAMLKTDPGIVDPAMQQRYMEWIEDIIEERQPKSAQQKWEDADEQLLIKLRVKDGLPTKEIAAQMQRTPKAIERKWSKLRKKYDLAPTVPTKSAGRGGSGASGDDASLQFEDLLNSVHAVVSNTEDPYAAANGAPAPVYKPPASSSSGRKRKRDPAPVLEDPTEQLFDPKRIKSEAKFDIDAIDDPTRHLTDAAAAISQQPAVPILGPLTSIPSQFLLFAPPVVQPAPQHPSAAQPAAVDSDNLLKLIQQLADQQQGHNMHPSPAHPPPHQHPHHPHPHPHPPPQQFVPTIPLPQNMIHSFHGHHF